MQAQIISHYVYLPVTTMKKTMMMMMIMKIQGEEMEMDPAAEVVLPSMLKSEETLKSLRWKAHWKLLDGRICPLHLGSNRLYMSQVPRLKSPRTRLGVSLKQDHVKRGKVLYYGQPNASFGSTGSTKGMETESSDTDVPGDDDFPVEWDEWSEFEKGYVPKATWTKDNEYDFESGKVATAAPRSYQPA